MKALWIALALMDTVKEVLLALKDGKLTIPEMINIAQCSFAAFGSAVDFGDVTMEFDDNGDLNIIIPKKAMEALTIEIDLVKDVQ